MEEMIHQLVESGDHQAILALEGEQYRPWKAIAAIKLGEYKKALLYAERGSFEFAYALYKLHRYKHALRILRKLKTPSSDVLMSQCLYFLGYYADAYDILSKVDVNDEFAVNLAAFEALDDINTKNRFKASLFSTEHKNSIQNKVKSKFTSEEARVEYEYNLLFKYIEDERLFIRRMQDLYESTKNETVDKQLKNLHSEPIQDLGVRERETVEFNSGQRSSFTNPVHFQKNFVENSKSEYKTFVEYLSPGKEKDFAKINSGSEKMRLLKAYLSIKAGRKNNNKTKELLEKCPDSPLKNALLLLINQSETGPSCDGKFQDVAIATLKSLQSISGSSTKSEL